MSTAAPSLDLQRDADLVGTFHRIGDLGPAYEVLEVEAGGFVRICVLESGETLSYPAAEVRSDPEA